MRHLPKETFLEFQKEELDEIFGVLMPQEIAARQYFEEMTNDAFDAMDNHPDDAVKSIGLHALYKINASAITVQHVFEKMHIDTPDIVSKWFVWEDKMYPELLARNPKLELHDMLKELSEAYYRESWPWWIEDLILAWLRTGDYQQMPDFYRDRCIPSGLDEKFFNRLCEVYKAAGGWLSKDNEENHLEFISDSKI